MAVKIGIFGGTGLNDPDVLEGRSIKSVSTPFGPPSDSLVVGTVKGVECAILARHGRKHDILPSGVNYRANIYALKNEGCTHVLATTACGSLREDYAPGDLVVLDQFIDRTTKRATTFYDASCDEFRGICHIPMHTPFCKHTRQLITDSLGGLGIKHHTKGTVLTCEGPRFSTKAESNMFRMWGADVINMTSVPEVVLAKEAGLCYASIGLVTDYDCWREEDSAEHVTAGKVFEVMRTNAEKAKKVLLDVIPKIAEKDWTEIIKTYQDEVKSSTF